MEPDSRIKIKDNLIPISEGCFLAKSDRLLWQKILKMKPEHAEAMYHVALEIEKRAVKNLDNFTRSRIEGYLTAYHKGMKESLDLMKRSFKKGNFRARNEILRMQEEIQTTEKSLRVLNQKVNQSNTILSYLFLSMIIGLLLLIVFLVHNRFSF